MLKKSRNTDIFIILLLLLIRGQTTTVATTTVAVTTVAGTTVAGTTVAGTTVVGTTVAGTTVAGTTVASTTVVGTTVAGTTVAGTTIAGTTVAGTTAAGTIVANITTPAATTMGAGNCTDAPTCDGLSSVACRFPDVVTDCPLLCHLNSSCAIKERSTVRTSFRLTDEVYNINLANPSSAAFIALKNSTENKVGSALTRELGGRFVSIVVNGFTRGSVVVDAAITIAEEDQRVAIETVTKAIISSGVSGLDTSSVKIACSSGFVNVNSQCLIFSSQRLTWNASGSACGRLSGRLVVPTDFQKMASYIIRNDLFYWDYWVGASATNQSDPSTYKWLDGTVVESSLWYPGYPLTPGTSPDITLGQACVKLHPNSNTNNGLIGSWDSNCNGTSTFRYICEE